MTIILSIRLLFGMQLLLELFSTSLCEDIDGMTDHPLLGIAQALDLVVAEGPVDIVERPCGEKVLH